jgi:hypothetical protein
MASVQEACERGGWRAVLGYRSQEVGAPASLLGYPGSWWGLAGIDGFVAVVFLEALSRGAVARD